MQGLAASSRPSAVTRVLPSAPGRCVPLPAAALTAMSNAEGLFYNDTRRTVVATASLRPHAADFRSHSILDCQVAFFVAVVMLVQLTKAVCALELVTSEYPRLRQSVHRSINLPCNRRDLLLPGLRFSAAPSCCRWCSCWPCRRSFSSG